MPVKENIDLSWREAAGSSSSSALERYSELSPPHDEILSLGGQGGRGKGAAGAREGGRGRNRTASE